MNINYEIYLDAWYIWCYTLLLFYFKRSLMQWKMFKKCERKRERLYVYEEKYIEAIKYYSKSTRN